MEDSEFSKAVTKLIEDPNLDPAAARLLLIALTADNRHKTAAHNRYYDERLEQLGILIEEQSKSITKLITIIEKHQDYIDTHPSLVYLLRFRTKETIAVILFITMILSIWYVSGIRQPILKFLGLPVF